MAGIESVGAVGGGADMDEFKKIQTQRVTEAQTQRTEAQQGGGDQGAAQSVGNAQGAPANQEYPKL